METKICSKCKQEKSVGEFNKETRKKYGLRTECRECSKQYYAENKEKFKENYKLYRAESKENIKKYNKKYYAENKEKIKESRKQYREKNPKKIKEIAKKYYLENSEEIRKNKKQYREKNLEIYKNARLKRKYGITLEQYNAMSQEQDNVCFICKQQKKLVVDHCHNTGAVRGLLCNECNTAIGFLKETPQYFINALEYLEVYNSKNEQKMLG